MMFSGEDLDLRPVEPCPEIEVRDCAEQKRFEQACARELRGEAD